MRMAENQENVETLHKKLIDSENLRMQLASKAERVEADVIKVEKEGEAQRVSDEQEKQSMHASYGRLEGIVISHLSNLRSALDDDLKTM
jgi:hypothetical protein